MKRFHSYLAVCLAPFLLALALVSCAQMGVPTPTTFNQRLAVAVVTVTEVRNTAATLLAAGKISVEDAKNIQAQADVAREGLNVARGVSVTDLAAASTRLEAMNTVLHALQTYLIARQGAPK
jgi:hypothetical protein